MAAVSRSGAPGRHVAAVRGRRPLSSGTFELTLTRPPAFDFRAGQRIRLFGTGLDRDYSLVSAEAAEELALCIRRVSGGRFSDTLSHLPPGAPVSFAGPYGYLVFRPSGRPAVWVATGTGIAPFVAMVRSGVRPDRILHGVGDASHRYYADELQSACPRYVACLSRETLDRGAGAFSGRVTGFLADALAPGAYDFYLCGRREMIRDAMFIIDDRFAGSRVYSEIFF